MENIVGALDLRSVYSGGARRGKVRVDRRKERVDVGKLRAYTSLTLNMACVGGL